MRSKLSIALIGPGNVGRAFLKQISNDQSLLLVATMNTRRMTLGTRPEIDADMDAFIAHISNLHPCVVVDCTASQFIASSYPMLLRLNISIVTPNKKAFSSDIQLFQEIKALSLNKWPLCYHESSVGAGLPLLSTVQDLVETEDSIQLVSGVFSGTLSYIFNTFCSPSNKLSFSEIVKDAMQKGFTEPDPRDDLNGVDVARKVVILARLTGNYISLSDVTVASLVPLALESASTDEFMSRLPDFDELFEQQLRDARANNQVLRYVGVVEKDACLVELKAFDISHPFAGLTGSDNIIQIKTARFPNSIVIQGAGAGDDVTAFGMYSDILKIQREL